MRKRGTRIDILDEEGRPGYYRMIRFGNFSEGDGSKEMIVNKLDLEEFFIKASKILHPQEDEQEADGAPIVSSREALEQKGYRDMEEIDGLEPGAMSGDN